MENILCEYVFTKVESKNGYSICKYKAKDTITTPDKKGKCTFYAKGKNLPAIKSITYELEGEWELYKGSYTLNVIGTDEIIPNDMEGIISYLRTLNGISDISAHNLYSKFGREIFDIIENDSYKLREVRGISKSKADSIAESYAKRKTAKELFSYLSTFHISDKKIMEIKRELGDKALSIIRENPYMLIEAAGVSFYAADAIANSESVPVDSKERIEAGIIEVLRQSEQGGRLFRKDSVFPDFVYDRFLQKAIFDLLFDEDQLYVTGNSYLPRDIAYLMTLKLLKIPLSEEEFTHAAVKLQNQNKAFIYVNDGNICFYRKKAAMAEFNASKRIIELLAGDLQEIKDISLKVNNAEKKMGVKLSDEQSEAVKMALTNSMSIITGGPGTGKTSVQKCILSVFDSAFPLEDALLLAPTGRAAKRMTESTGYPAYTLHKALRIHNTDNIENEKFYFNQRLIIIDEASMLGNYILENLLSHIAVGTRIVFVGDTEQLPSIESGSVLRELLLSNVIPATRLNKTFRQASGSLISINCARIRVFEHALEYGNDFKFIECDNSESIVSKTCSLMPILVNRYGENNVACLTAYKRATASGVNSLNYKLRKSLRKNINSESPSFESNGTTFYEGDKIMFTKNNDILTNGDIGFIRTIIRKKGYLEVQCVFNDEEIVLHKGDISNIELAYATTVHKSQGSEYKAVIMILDEAHKNLSNPLLYTALSRAKKQIYIIGQKSAMDLAISIQDNKRRRSNLSSLINRFYEN